VWPDEQEWTTREKQVRNQTHGTCSVGRPWGLHEGRVPTLTLRQRQVIALLAAGRTEAEISSQLGISPRTVRAHCDALRSKLGVSHRRYLPFAYRLLTGEDPLHVELGAAVPVSLAPVGHAPSSGVPA